MIKVTFRLKFSCQVFRSGSFTLKERRKWPVSPQRRFEQQRRDRPKRRKLHRLHRHTELMIPARPSVTVNLLWLEPESNPGRRFGGAAPLSGTPEDSAPALWRLFSGLEQHAASLPARRSIRSRSLGLKWAAEHRGWVRSPGPKFAMTERLVVGLCSVLETFVGFFFFFFFLFVLLPLSFSARHTLLLSWLDL